jgi:hypothetical protein
MESKDSKENQRVRSSFGRLSPSRWLKGDITAAILLCISIAAGAAIIGSCGPSVVADCYWDAKVFTWVDVNADGIFQEGEPPLPEVNILIDGERSYVTNSVGEIQFGGGFYGCPQTRYKITTEEPAGYQLTTVGTQFVRASGGEQSFQFGFTYLPGVPTVTPKPKSPLSCVVTPEFTGEEVYSITSDKDSLWVASSSKVAQLDFSTNAWVVYPGGKAYSGTADRIFIGPDGGVWLITYHMKDGSRTIYRSNNGVWEEFSPRELKGKEVESVNWAPDGRLWFPTYSDGTMIWDPHTNIWTSDAGKNAYEVLFTSDGEDIPIKEFGGGAIAPDGKIWGVEPSHGYFWNGTYYDPVTKKITESAISTADDLGLCYLDMAFDDNGGMWLAVQTCGTTVGYGLLYIPDPINGSQASWKEYHKDSGFKSDNTNSLLWQGNNLLWVGTKEGLARCQIETP